MQESKCGALGDGGQTGEQQASKPGSVAGARGSGAAEARARPNVEVNRRAEGTSELNRRLGAVEKGAATLERCGVAGDYGRGLAGKQARCSRSVPRRPSSGPATEALPENEEVEQQKPERGLTYEVNRRAEGTSELNRRLGGGARSVSYTHLTLPTKRIV